VTSPQERLEQTRDELKLLLKGDDDRSHQTDVFPRSATMRLLLGASGKGVATTVAFAAVTRFMPQVLRWLAQLLFRTRGSKS
jgi:hypothetical protein